MADADDRRPTGLRKLSSLSGVVPLGAFLLLHTWISLSAASARETYDRQVGLLHGGPLLGFLELVLVVAPLVVHGGYGIYRSIQPIEKDHTYDSTLMVTLQRVSGVVVLIFVVAHVYEFRGQTFLSGLQVASYSTTLVEHLSSTVSGVPLIAFGYLVGIAASFFHLANGMTSFCTTWGVTPTPASQQRARLFFRILGVLFFAVSAALVLQLATGSRIFPAEPPPSPAALCGSAVPVMPPPPTAPSVSPSSAPSSSASGGALPNAPR